MHVPSSLAAVLLAASACGLQPARLHRIRQPQQQQPCQRPPPPPWRWLQPSGPRARAIVASEASTEDTVRESPPQGADAVALAFGAALSRAWAGDGAGLRQLLRSDAQVVTPMWQCDDRASYEAQIAGAHSFFKALSAPALIVLSHRVLSDGRAQVSWRLGLEWPAAWRPRVNIIGESVLTLEPSGGGGGGAAAPIRSVEETWHQRPRDVFASQVLPKFRDLASVWATPTAEHVPIPTVREGGNALSGTYEVVRLPPMLALQSEWLESGEMIKYEQAPLPPWYAFTGEVKRADWCALTNHTH